jgi:hypothetical protein
MSASLRRAPVRPSPPAAVIGSVARVAAVAMAVVLLALTGCSSDNPGESVDDTTTVVTEPTTTTSTTEAPIDEGQVVYVYSPSVGDCFDRRRVQPEQGGPRVILLLDCGLPHAFEVFGVFEFDTSALQPPSGTAPSFPGEDPLTADARLRCPPLFAEWVGLPYELSELELSWLLPSQDNWASGDRTIGCTIFDPSTERTTGTTRDIQR